jgi:glycosyltransferase involved in cell wall biosynthesis
MLYDESAKEAAPRLAIILPCYNEEESIRYAAEHLIYIVGELIADGIISKDSFLFFVDDGSSDNSWEVITALHQKGNAIEPVAEPNAMKFNICY